MHAPPPPAPDTTRKIIRDITGADVTDGYLRIVPSVGGAIYAWASVVDNVSTDQTFVRPIPNP